MIAFGLSLKDTDENPHQDKWAQIRKNDAERHARRQKEGQRKEGDSQEMSEESMYTHSLAHVVKSTDTDSHGSPCSQNQSPCRRVDRQHGYK